MYGFYWLQITSSIGYSCLYRNHSTDITTNAALIFQVPKRESYEFRNATSLICRLVHFWIIGVLNWGWWLLLLYGVGDSAYYLGDRQQDSQTDYVKTAADLWRDRSVVWQMQYDLFKIGPILLDLWCCFRWRFNTGKFLRQLAPPREQLEQMGLVEPSWNWATRKHCC